MSLPLDDGDDVSPWYEGMAVNWLWLYLRNARPEEITIVLRLCVCVVRRMGCHRDRFAGELPS